MTDITARLISLRDKVAALERLAGDEHSDTARELARALLDEIDAVAADANTQAGDTTTAETFRSDGGEVEVCPRCTLRSFRPKSSGADAGMLYTCSSCGYRARLEPGQNR